MNNRQARLWLLLAALTVGSQVAQAQKITGSTAEDVTLRNRARGKPASLNGITETLMPNGLTVITKEVHAAPVVYFSVWYKVGSVDESVGQTGMSHLMEHMMFKGTKTRGPGVIALTLQNNGAEFNANTSFDRTCYFETLAADRLELAMQIESDRMVNSVYDEKQHQKEMTVVRSEYEAGENDPGSALGKAVRLAAYQVNPYRWQPIGFRADIENFTRDEMYAYYKKYYTPNNAFVVIVGDFKTARALDLVRKYFGAIPGHPVKGHFITPEPAQEGERRVELRRVGTTPDVQLCYHIPGFGHRDRYVLDIIETVLSTGRTSRFFQDLVQSGLASDAAAYDYDLELPDLFTVSVTPQAGHSNVEIEQAVLAELEKLKNEPITTAELDRALRQAAAEYVYDHESVTQQGEELGENAIRGDWRFGEHYLEHLRLVTPADVRRVAKKYLTERNRTVGYFDPISPTASAEPAQPGQPAQTAAPSAAGATPATGPGSAPVTAPAAGGAATAGPAAGAPAAPLIRVKLRTPLQIEAAAATLPAPHRPAAAPRPSAVRSAVAHAAGARPVRVVLPNGLTLIVQENHATPTVSISGALLSAGGVFDPADKPGLANFTATQLSRGTQSRSLFDIATMLENVDATASVAGGDEFVTLSGHSLTHDFNTVLDVLADELRHPAFPPTEFQRAQAQSLAVLRPERENTGTQADIAFSEALFPRNHPYWTPSLDQEESVIKGLTRDDLVAFHDAHYAPDHLIISIVGDVKVADAIAAVTKYFGDWPKKGDLPPISIPNTPLPSGPMKTIVIPMADKAQVDVRYGYPGGLKRSDPNFYRVIVLDTILGGGSGLASRLGKNVRDRMGLVYGIYAGHEASLGEGPFTIEFGSNPANVDKAIAESLRQLRLMRTYGVTQAEVSNAVNYLTGSYAVTLSTNSAVAGQLLVSQIYALGLDYIQKRNSYYRAVTLAQVDAAARKYLDPGIGALVIAGTYNGKYAPASGG